MPHTYRHVTVEATGKQRGDLLDPSPQNDQCSLRAVAFGGGPPVGGFGHRDDLFRAYEQAGGGPVDPAHVRFWEAFGCIKWALMCMHKGLGALDPAAGAGPGARRSVEAVAIGRRIEEPLLDFLDLITGKPN
jgi:hypothetical protein